MLLALKIKYYNYSYCNHKNGCNYYNLTITSIVIFNYQLICCNRIIHTVIVTNVIAVIII